MLKIRDIEIKNPIITAPMASVTNLAYRQILMKYQPGLYFNEMVSDQAVNYRNEKTLAMLKCLPNEHPIAFQLFGHDVEHMVKAAQYLDTETECDIIDINMGCPVNKVVKTGAGSSLLKDIEHAALLVKRVKAAVSKPVTVKIRSGWDSQSINAVAMAKALEAAGADAITIHARTRAQMYEGQADWSIIKAVKEAVSIPVFGNGDVTSGELAVKMMRETGCDGVMIGRGLLGSPWIIQEAKLLLENNRFEPITLDQRFALLDQHCLNLIDLLGEENAMKQMRSHATWAFKGLKHSHRIKTKLVVMKTYAEFVKILSEYKGSVENE